MYTIKAKIHSKRRIIGYILEHKGKDIPFHINTVLKLAEQGKIVNIKVSRGRLKSTDVSLRLMDIPGGFKIRHKYSTPSYRTADKHSHKEEYWGIVTLYGNKFPTYALVGTYRDAEESLLGYKLFCMETLEEYSLYLFETHQIVIRGHIVSEFGEEVKRERVNWDWRFYFPDDPEGYDRIDDLPREYLGICRPPTGGHLERDNLFKIWEATHQFNKILNLISDELRQKN